MLAALPVNGLAADDATADPVTTVSPAEFDRAGLEQADLALKAARPALIDCESGCITPGEATILAFAANEDGGEAAARPGRFLLDVKGGGQSLHGELGGLLFVNSRRDYATLGTLTIAFDADALHALLRRPSGCGAADVIDGQITVKACRGPAISDLNMFTMMQRLSGRRIIVDGVVKLQWIDSPLGSPRPVANKRGEHEIGYYQVWVHVTDAAQVTFIYDD
ncbi:MAG: hypothetical protein GW768_06540 [Sphingomonadales bacterium]|nr:hypothetical protein [Sphingomonadales bacterium]